MQVLDYTKLNLVDWINVFMWFACKENLLQKREQISKVILNHFM